MATIRKKAQTILKGRLKNDILTNCLCSPIALVSDSQGLIMLCDLFSDFIGKKVKIKIEEVR